MTTDEEDQLTLVMNNGRVWYKVRKEIDGELFTVWTTHNRSKGDHTLAQLKKRGPVYPVSVAANPINPERLPARV